MNVIADRLAAVRERIDAALVRSGRAPGAATLVAVSKTFGPEIVAEAFRAGLTVFGENKVQEAEAKIPRVEAIIAGGEGRADGALPGDPSASRGGDQGIRDPHPGEKWGGGGIQTPVAGAAIRRPSWHLVGHLQSNKAKTAAGRFDLIHSVDDAALAVKLDRAARELDWRQPILVQVNVAREGTKSGVAPEDLRALVEGAASLENLDVRGLMTIPPYDADPERSRRHFAALRELGRQVRTWLGSDLDRGELSMGMSEDFEVAIEEGATIVRIGRALFGERPDRLASDRSGH